MDIISRARQAGKGLILLTLMAASGCIVVVGEDDFGRGHHLHGSSWYLEVIWVHGHSYRVQDSAYAINFKSADELTGSAGCASFTAGYDVDDETIRISRFRTSTYGCANDEVQGLYLEYLPEASDVDLGTDRLELTTSTDVRMVFRK